MRLFDQYQDEVKDKSAAYYYMISEVDAEIASHNSARDEENQRLRAALIAVLPIIEAEAEVSHFTDGFVRKPPTDKDRLLEQVREAIRDGKP